MTVGNGWQIIRMKVGFRKQVRGCVGDFWGFREKPMSKDESRFNCEKPKVRSGPKLVRKCLLHYTDKDLALVELLGKPSLESRISERISMTDLINMLGGGCTNSLAKWRAFRVGVNFRSLPKAS